MGAPGWPSREPIRECREAPKPAGALEWGASQTITTIGPMRRWTIPVAASSDRESGGRAVAQAEHDGELVDGDAQRPIPLPEDRHAAKEQAARAAQHG
jgi:hypothetical protein